jgi:universal stress protein A
MDNAHSPRVVLAPTDMSASSLRAVRYAAALARQAGATLVLFRAITPREAEEGVSEGRFVDVQIEETRAQLLWWFATFVPEELRRGLPVQAVAAIGHPEREIPAAASRLRADLIVMATHGRTGLRRAVLGSVADAVVRHAPCPVLTLRGDAVPAASPLVPAGRR